MSFPPIGEKSFYPFINKKWSALKIPSPKPDVTVKELCTRGKFEKQNQQKFVADFLAPNTPYDRLLVYHGLGSGKCVHPNSSVTIQDPDFKKINMTIEDIWKLYADELLKTDKDGGEWYTVNNDIYAMSYDTSIKSFFNGRVDKIYRQYVNEEIKRIRTVGGYEVTITKIHKLYTNRGWTNEFNVGSKVCIREYYKGTPCPIFDTIESIKCESYKGYVYDLEVETYHNFVANGVICHNTCASISIAEKWKSKAEIIVILPASLEGNYRNELRSQCSDIVLKTRSVNPYITDKERLLLNRLDPSDSRYKKILSISNRRIDKHYRIMSYEKFARDSKRDDISFTGKVVIIDEVQNIVSTTGMRYKELIRRIDITSPKRLVLLSATPIFDNPVELALTVNLLKPEKERFPTGNKGEFINRYLAHKQGKLAFGPTEEAVWYLNNEEELKNRLRGIISYFRGANPKAYPTKIEKTVKCQMSKFQADRYWKTAEDVGQDIFKMKNNFYIASRSASNIVYPNGMIGEDGYSVSNMNMFTANKIGEYSCKLKETLNIVKNTQGPIFIYSNFVKFSGVNQIVAMLKMNGFVDYGSGLKGPKVAVFSGEESQTYRNTVVREYNMTKNIDGSLVKVIVGSPSIKEGVTLKRTRAVIMFDPYWNQSRMDQVIGRSVRYCSHADMPIADQIVNIYLLEAVDSNVTEQQTIDTQLYKLAKKKYEINELLNTLLKEVAVDCTLFKNANQPPNHPCFEPITDYHLEMPKNTVVGTLAQRIPKVELRFSANKTKILNEKDIGHLAMFIDDQYKSDIVPIIVTYVKGKETKKLGEERLKEVKKILKRVGIKNEISPSVLPMSRAVARFARAKKSTPKGLEATGPKERKKRVTIPGCPRDRRVKEDGSCSKLYPFKAVNKQGYECCYKRKTKDKAKKKVIPGEASISKPSKSVFTKTNPPKTTKSASKPGKSKTKYMVETKNGKVYLNKKLCMGYKADELKEVAKRKKLKIDGRVTKQKICDALKS